MEASGRTSARIRIPILSSEHLEQVVRWRPADSGYRGDNEQKDADCSGRNSHDQTGRGYFFASEAPPRRVKERQRENQEEDPGRSLAEQSQFSIPWCTAAPDADRVPTQFRVQFDIESAALRDAEAETEVRSMAEQDLGPQQKSGLWWLPGTLIGVVGVLAIIGGFVTGGPDAFDGLVFGGVAIVAAAVILWRRRSS